MKQWAISDLQRENWIDYNDGDIVIVDDISNIKDKRFKKSFVDMVVMVFCIKGRAEIVMNEKRWHLVQDEVLICTPNTFVEDYTSSRDFDSKIVGFSTQAVDSSLVISKNVWRNLYYVFQNPVLHLGKDNMQMIMHYYYIAESKLHGRNNIYYKEIMHSLLSCIIYEFLVITDRNSSEGDLMKGDEVKQGDILFRRFIELLSKEKGMIRSVAQAADKLNVSSKYLSAVIKNSSGKNALDIIHRYTMQEIVRRLKYTDKSIQEISNDMNFPSVSFFGKFVKQQTGMSPKQYRKNGGSVQ